ncbi:unnamed protein product [Adineta ricciae]|uniref:Nuclear receptor domain-containing protein n=1 Tax=Adineta ricciae TaxID=249248 RepID=A0A815BZN3_ADIRI|nr:unnamed protein product [Adineta ricciae]
MNETDITRQQKTTASTCKVCGESAQYSYYGAIVCRSCKVFFRRNILKKSTPLRCDYDGNCEININNRRICTYCRLTKCFAVGMTSDLIRGPQTAKHRKAESRSSTVTALARINEASLIPTVNLLRADQSTLSVDQWNQISNIVHCFDTYSGFAFVENFVKEQDTLPLKSRFKYSSVSNFFTSVMTSVQLVFEKNRDFLSLSAHDRNTLLHHTVEYTTGVGVASMLCQVQLFANPSFFNSAELIFRPPAVASFVRLIDQLDPDVSVVKLMCAILSFMTSRYTTYSSTVAANLSDVTAVIRIQDMYGDLVWRYLLYKYNYRDAVLRFFNLIKCFFLMNDSIAEAYETRKYADMINSVIESTEHMSTFEG